VKLLKEGCLDIFDEFSCDTANEFCSREIANPFESDRNPYDVSKACQGSIEDMLCYPVTKHISSYLSRPEVKQTLGVDPSITRNFTSCNGDVSMRFGLSRDGVRETYLWVGALLERSIKVLVYVGVNDWICNWVGNERWMLNLEWSGKANFTAQPLREWVVNGKRVGKTRKAGPLTFATVDGAGHVVKLFASSSQELGLTMPHRYLMTSLSKRWLW